MARQYYPALVHSDDGKTYGVSFPDLPAIVTTGDSLPEALANAEDAATLYVEEWLKDGKPLPSPSSLDAARATVDAEDLPSLVTVQMVPAIIPGKTARYTITMDEELMRRIDLVSGHYGRSGWIAEAARGRLLSENAAIAPRRAVAEGGGQDFTPPTKQKSARGERVPRGR
jgi:predicted RNase H-like HicB family nuclease